MKRIVTITAITASLVGGGIGAAIAATAQGPATSGPEYSQGDVLGLCVNPATRASYWETKTDQRDNCANGYFQARLPVDPNAYPIYAPCSFASVAAQPAITITPGGTFTIPAVSSSPASSCG